MPPHANEVVLYKFIQSSEENNSNGGFSFITNLLDGNKGMARARRPVEVPYAVQDSGGE